MIEGDDIYSTHCDILSANDVSLHVNYISALRPG